MVGVGAGYRFPGSPSSMTAPTHFKRDIFRQTSELATTVKLLAEMYRPRLARAAELVRDSRYVFLTGIGASWNAAMGTAALFGQRGFPVYTVEAAELLYDTTVPPGSVVIAISRSGRSAEIVQLSAKLRQAGATLIGITNSPDSPLAKESSVAIVIPIQLDYAISVNTYSTLLVAAAALASFDTPDFDSSCASFLAALPAVEKSVSAWEEMVSHSPWLDPERNFYFLARGPSIASCYQARLLWEEGAKSPATAMTSSGFTLGAAVALIGQDLPTHAADLIFQIPPVPAGWQFAVDVIPMQLAAETLALLRGVDCDSFRICSYIVENEYGLLGKDHPRKLNGGRIGLKDS